MLKLHPALIRADKLKKSKPFNWHMLELTMVILFIVSLAVLTIGLPAHRNIIAPAGLGIAVAYLVVSLIQFRRIK